MYDPTIHPRNLARQLRDADFIADPLLFDLAHREGVLTRAAKIGSIGFIDLALAKNNLRNKPIYRVNDLGQTLVLRQITSNIQRVTGVKQDDRRFIVECISSLLREGVAFRLYKYDVKSFYESVRVPSLVSSLSQDIAFSGQSARVITSFFKELETLGVAGLPRGLSVSATLAEYLMRDFDAFISRHKNVLYYSRYVDDICIITDGAEKLSEFYHTANSVLPDGLTFNDKSKSFDFGDYGKNKVEINEHKIDYLGYRLHISKSFKPTNDSPICRSVWLDISPNKVKKIKSRIIYTLLEYNRSGSFADLRDRIRLLTCNFTLKDRNTQADRLSGIRFNYPLVDSTRSTALPELDRFLCNAIMSPHMRNRARPTMTKAQAKDLIKYRFINGFENKIFFHFSPNRLANLTQCWSYV